MIEVPNITSTTAETSASSTTAKPTRGASKSYYCTAVCDNLDDALQLVKEEKIWTVKSKVPSAIYYRCNLQKKRAKPQCSASVCIKKHSNSNKLRY